MLEHIVTSYLTKHLTNCNILFELQHGFMEKRFCGTQLVILHDEICKNMQMWKQLDLILLDFSKVFNKIAHKTNFKITLLWNLGQNTKLGYHYWVKYFSDSRCQAVVFLYFLDILPDPLSIFIGRCTLYTRGCKIKAYK